MSEYNKDTGHHPYKERTTELYDNTVNSAGQMKRPDRAIAKIRPAQVRPNETTQGPRQLTDAEREKIKKLVIKYLEYLDD